MHLFFRALRPLCHPETLLKIGFYKEVAPEELKDLYHPSQLEVRFGGEAETPTRFWPPYMGKEFNPSDDWSHLKFMEREDYAQILDENPKLERHPEYLRRGDWSRDYRLADDADGPGEDED